MTAIDATKIAPRRAAGLAPSTWVAGTIAALLVIIAIFAPLIAPYPENAGNVLLGFGEPSAEHWLGTDSGGRDLLSRLIYGSRTAMLGATLVTIIAGTLGATIGIVSAWFAGPVDMTISAILAILFAFPGIIAALVASALFGSSLVIAILAVSIPMLPSIARVTRGEALRQRSMPYIQSCITQGMSGWAVCFRHLLPNVMPIIVAQVATVFGYSMMGIAALSYLGLGVRAPNADWGLMVSAGQAGVMRGHPQESIFAGIALMLAVTSFTILADAIAAKYDRGLR